jgi:hypothetical protein
MDYTPLVLKNKGIPVQFCVVKKVSDVDYEREYDEVGEPLKETVYIRFTNNVIADIEEHWGNLEAWQTSLEAQPITTLRQTIAFATKRPVRSVGEAMIEGESMDYSNAIGVAWALANGVDPIAASRMLKQSKVLAEEQRKILSEALTVGNSEETEDSPGESGTPPGRKRAAPLKNSGNSAPAK